VKKIAGHSGTFLQEECHGLLFGDQLLVKNPSDILRNQCEKIKKNCPALSGQ